LKVEGLIITKNNRKLVEQKDRKLVEEQNEEISTIAIDNNLESRIHF
jgi:hypothetical protein